MNNRMKVFITVDTEIWPLAPRWQEKGLVEDFRRDIVGATEQGDFGIHYQIDVLNAFKLKAVFFVEALFASAVGSKLLKEIVNVIQSGGHEVQLHLHTDWLPYIKDSGLPTRTGQYLKNFSEEQQAVLIKRGIENLKQCGVNELCAFRAGHYGANNDTLRALAQNEIRVDSSYNVPYLNRACGFRFTKLFIQPERLDNVWEFPISFIRDYPGHYRHAQLCALSSTEMQKGLWQAWTNGWHSFVIVLHSFELLNRGELKGKPILPDKIILRRWNALCRFLAVHADKFETSTFSNVDLEATPMSTNNVPLKSSVISTAWRVLEQARRRLP